MNKNKINLIYNIMMRIAHNQCIFSDFEDVDISKVDSILLD